MVRRWRRGGGALRTNSRRARLSTRSITLAEAPPSNHSCLVALPRAARRTPRPMRRHLWYATCNAMPMHILTYNLVWEKTLNSKVAPGIPAFLIQAWWNIGRQLGFVSTNFCRNVTSLYSVFGRKFCVEVCICCMYSITPFLWH